MTNYIFPIKVCEFIFQDSDELFIDLDMMPVKIEDTYKDLEILTCPNCGKYVISIAEIRKLNWWNSTRYLNCDRCRWNQKVFLFSHA